jgi:hypothetical protein
LLGAIYFAIDAAAAARSQPYGLAPCCRWHSQGAGGAALALFGVRDGWFAYGASLAVTLLTIGFIVNPRLDATRSGRAFMTRVAAASTGVAELGLVGAKEQYLLQLRRPSTNFGHGRWRSPGAEAADAAAWFAAKPGRALLVGARRAHHVLQVREQLNWAGQPAALVPGHRGASWHPLYQPWRPAPCALHSAKCVQQIQMVSLISEAFMSESGALGFSNWP